MTAIKPTVGINLEISHVDSCILGLFPYFLYMQWISISFLIFLFFMILNYRIDLALDETQGDYFTEIKTLLRI